MVQLQLARALAIAACALPALHAQAVDVSFPSSPPSDTTVVKGNFLGVSFELSVFDKYCELNLNSYSGVQRSCYGTSTHTVTKLARTRLE